MSCMHTYHPRLYFCSSNTAAPSCTVIHQSTLFSASCERTHLLFSTVARDTARRLSTATAFPLKDGRLILTDFEILWLLFSLLLLFRYWCLRLHWHWLWLLRVSVHCEFGAVVSVLL